MSATGRGAARSPSDFYATPFSAFNPLICYLDKDICYVDPAAGDGRLVVWMRKYGVRADGSDLNTPAKQFDAAICEIEGGYNYLESLDAPEGIVTNPPYSIAQEFVTKAVSDSREVFMLLRLNFLASQRRAQWWTANKPNALLVLSKRPSFLASNKTDATDYAWFYWGRRHQGIYFL